MSFGLLLLLAGVLLLLPTAYAAKIGAPWAPTRLAAVRRALEKISLGHRDVLVDLGAGDGKILLAAARQGAKAIGYELSPIMWVIAKIRSRGKSQIFFRDFYRQKLPAETTVIFAFLMPASMPRLRQFLRGQRLPAARYVLAYAFPFRDVPPVEVIREPRCAPLYVYAADELVSKP